MNPGCDSIKIMCGTCIGHAEECNETEIYTVDQEDVEEMGNYDAVTRLNLGSDSTVQATGSGECASSSRDRQKFVTRHQGCLLFQV